MGIQGSRREYDILNILTFFRTKHGACPVLYGSKWISNKWFRTQGNELNRLCPTVMYPDLLPDADLRIPAAQRFDRTVRR